MLAHEILPPPRPGPAGPCYAVVLHGLGDSREGWKPVAPELAIPELGYVFVDAPDPYLDGYSWFPIPGFTGEVGEQELHAALGRSRAMLAELVAHLLASLELPSERLMSDAELAVFVDSFRRSGFTGPINWYRNFTRNWELLADVPQQVHHPALMIHGRYDMVPPNPDLAEYVPEVEVHTLECGHWIQQEQPEAANRLILDWLERRNP